MQALWKPIKYSASLPAAIYVLHRYFTGSARRSDVQKQQNLLPTYRIHVFITAAKLLTNWPVLWLLREACLKEMERADCQELQNSESHNLHVSISSNIPNPRPLQMKGRHARGLAGLATCTWKFSYFVLCRGMAEPMLCQKKEVMPKRCALDSGYVSLQWLKPSLG